MTLYGHYSQVGFRAVLALAGALLLTACAPGMKLNSRPSHESSNPTAGLEVTLHSLNTPGERMPEPPRTVSTPIDDLLVAQLPPYRIGPQDILLVTVWDHPEITLPLGQYRTDNATGMVVDEEGYFYFPYVGKLLIKGMTTSQARNALTVELAKVLRNPQVDLKILAFRSQKVWVGGEVKNPAVYNVTDVPFTLAEAMNRAGGFLPTADDSHVVLSRGNRTWTLNFHQLMASGNKIGQILLQDGDSLHVPTALENIVYVMGEVVKPGSIPLVHGRLSLAQALSDGGGIQAATADARSIYVIRQGLSPRAVDVFHLNGKNPATMVLAEQFTLRPRDLVFVDAGGLVRWNRVWSLLAPTFETLTGMATSTADIRILSK